MTKEELNYIKDAFSQIIDDIAGNPDWHEAARAVASDLGTLERKLEEKVSPLPSNLDEAADAYATESAGWNPDGTEKDQVIQEEVDAFKAGAKWMAEQGWSRELEVKEDAGGYPYIDKHIELYDYDTDTPFAKKGDKVIVQIRKK